MRKLYVPISTDPALHADVFLEDFRTLGVSHVFLAEGARLPHESAENHAFLMQNLREQIARYTDAGHDVGVWLSTLGYGGPLAGNSDVQAKPFTQIRSVVGREGGDAICPLDERFCARMERAIEDICRAGARMIMLDDELCLSVRPGLGCFCDRHLALLSERVGKTVTLDGLAEKVFTGAPNAYRYAWYDVMGDTLRDFCRRLRAAVDRVDPTIRMGFCAGYTSWDTEGVDAIELTRILAGNTKPFLRFTSAPYWFASKRFGNTTLASVIEFVRMQAAWCRDEGIEVFSECDTYPHDRYHVPRAYIECFDAATMLTPDVGVLKYFYHYPCQPENERGYIDAHLASAPVYEAMTDAFHAKREVGVRVYEEMHKIREATLPARFDRVKSQKQIMRKFAFSEAEALLSANAIPTVYEGAGLCGIAFGENAKYLAPEAFERGLILDLTAAELLQTRGIDVGLENATPLAFGALEDFGFGYPTQISNAAALYALAPKTGAVAKSHFVSTNYCERERGREIASYIYTNARGERFFVLGFRAEAQREDSGIYWNYLRGAQLADVIPWLGGKTLPAVCTGHPHLYCRCNEDEGGVSVAYFNCSADGIDRATVTFARPVTSVRVLGGKGRQVDAHSVELEDIRAYGYVCIDATYDRPTCKIAKGML